MIFLIEIYGILRMPCEGTDKGNSWQDYKGLTTLSVVHRVVHPKVDMGKWVVWWIESNPVMRNGYWMKASRSRWFQHVGGGSQCRIRSSGCSRLLASHSIFTVGSGRVCYACNRSVGACEASHSPSPFGNAILSMERNVIDLIMFLDICQLYLQSRKKNRGPCTLWAVLTFIRTEDSSEAFLRWCQSYTIPHLRYHDKTSSTSPKDKFRGFERKLVKILQDLFYCSCLPSGHLDF